MLSGIGKSKRTKLSCFIGFKVFSNREIFYSTDFSTSKGVSFNYFNVHLKSDVGNIELIVEGAFF